MQNFVSKSLSSLLAVFLCLTASSCQTTPPELKSAEIAAAASAADETEEIDIFLNIRIQVPDGTIYESTDDGETWFLNEKPSERPPLSAFFIGELPVPLSEGCKLYVYNDTGTLLHYGAEYQLLLESDEEWIPAFLSDHSTLYFTQELLTLPRQTRWHFDIATGIYEPIAGNYRYVKEFREEGNDEAVYIVTLEFPATAMAALEE